MKNKKGDAPSTPCAPPLLQVPMRPWNSTLVILFGVACGCRGLAEAPVDGTDATADGGGSADGHATVDGSRDAGAGRAMGGAGGKPVGSTCGAGGDCASDYCRAGLCTCNKPDHGYACHDQADCCAPGACRAGRCVSDAAVCVPVGQSCGADAGACCIGLCIGAACSCTAPPPFSRAVETSTAAPARETRTSPGSATATSAWSVARAPRTATARAAAAPRASARARPPATTRAIETRM